MGGSAGANELRWVNSGLGATGGTGSASWPYCSRPTVSPAAITEMWAFTADTTGYKVNYDGTYGHPQMLRLKFTNDGTFASAPRLTAFADTAHTAPSVGTQTPSPGDGRNIINGHATDTGGTATSYLKGNAFGSGYPTSGAQETPATTGNVGTAPTATTGTAGSVTTTTADWLNTHVAWQSLQGWVQYITAGAIPNPTTLFYWYLNLILFSGPNMAPGIFAFCPIVFDYTYS